MSEFGAGTSEFFVPGESGIKKVKVDDPGNTVGRRLPRALAPGVHWVGDCALFPTPQGLDKGKLEHAYSSAFLVVGDERSILVDTGHPQDWPVLKRQLDGLFAAGAAPLAFVFPTHSEVTHGGNLGRLLRRYPAARGVGGDMGDLSLIFPDVADRLDDVRVGDVLDLGNRRFHFVDAVFRDLPDTLWGYDEQEKVLFSSDGLGFGHYHGEEHCGKFAEEVPDLPIPELTGLFLEYALYWTRLKDVEPQIARLRRFVFEDYPVKIIAGAHGSPVTDPEMTMERIEQGMRELGERYALR
jgi:flavorubredoxin